MDKFKIQNLPLLLIVVYIAKSFFINPLLFDHLVLGLNSILFGYVLYLDYNKKPDISQEVFEQIKEIREISKKDKEFVQDYVNTELKKIDGKISAVNLSLGNQRQSKGNINEFRWG